MNGGNVVWLSRGTGSLQTPDLCNDEKDFNDMPGNHRQRYVCEASEAFRLCCIFCTNKRLELGPRRASRSQASRPWGHAWRFPIGLFLPRVAEGRLSMSEGVPMSCNARSYFIATRPRP